MISLKSYLCICIIYRLINPPASSSSLIALLVFIKSANSLKATTLCLSFSCSAIEHKWGIKVLKGTDDIKRLKRELEVAEICLQQNN